ncbi:MAG: cytochrome P450 [Sandaracinaceae bacterium]
MKHPTPPGPASRKSGLLGTIRNNLGFVIDPMGFVGGRFQRYGDIYFVGSDGSQPGLYVLRHPDHLQEVLVTRQRDFGKGHSAFATLSELLGEGLLTTDGETWRRQRRLLSPAFQKKRLEGYAAVMVDEAQIEVGRWSSAEIDVSKAMMEMTLRVVCRTLFGYDASGDTDAVSRAMHDLQALLGRPPLPIPKAIDPGRRRLARARRLLDDVIYPLIDSRSPGGLEDDLLQRMVDAADEDGSRLTRKEIRDQLVTLFLAGHETTSNALTWTFHLLGEHPEVEQALSEELDRVLAGRPPTAADLPALDLTTRVFTESMRLYPPVYVVSRGVLRDTTIGEWPVPAGSEVVMWIWHTHRDARFWEEPWRFDPDRFLPGRAAARPKLAYVPFGAGPRACIGKVFAQWEGVLMLATIAQRVRLRSLGGSVELSPRVTLSPAGGLKMRVERR